jgi:phosphomannomutase
MAALRDDPPRELAGLSFAQVRDYGRHEIRTLPENKKSADLPEPRSDLVFLETGGDGRCYTVAARPSGTEPKIKFYFFGRAECPGRDALAGLKADVGAEFLALQDAWSAWVKRRVEA